VGVLFDFHVSQDTMSTVKRRHHTEAQFIAYILGGLSGLVGFVALMMNVAESFDWFGRQAQEQLLQLQRVLKSAWGGNQPMGGGMGSTLPGAPLSFRGGMNSNPMHTGSLASPSGGDAVEMQPIGSSAPKSPGVLAGSAPGKYQNFQ
jgi:hypothetical protein